MSNWVRFLKTFALIISSLLLAASCAFAQDITASGTNTAPAQKLLTDTEVKAQYQNCPSGWYSGPRPGKARFAQDPFLWVVTPEFAKRFCMPPEFVSNDLKGAEAVAFRIVNKSDDVNCGLGGNPTVCAGNIELRFEVYIKSDVKLPKAHEGRYFQAATIPSRQLIGRTDKEWKAMDSITRLKPELALKSHFDSQQVGIEGVKDGKVVWPIVALYEQTHFGGIFEGIDYYAFEGSTGFFENPGIKQNNVTRFFLTFARSDRDKFKPRTGQSLSDYAHFVELPEDFTNKVSETDRTKGRNWGDLTRRAFAPLPATSTQTK